MKEAQIFITIVERTLHFTSERILNVNKNPEIRVDFVLQNSVTGVAVRMADQKIRSGL